MVHAPPRYARFHCPDSDETLSVEVTGEPPAPAQLYFECRDLDRTVTELKAKGLTFQQDPTEMSYLWREAHLRDPDGHELRLYYAGDNRLNPPWKVLTHELWVHSESAGYATRITENPHPGTNVKSLLMAAALYDQLVSNQATEIAARTLKLPSLVGSILPNRPAMLANVQGSFNDCDPHGRQAFTPAAVDQLFEFLQPGGQVVNFCNGLCDAAEPYELPFGGARPCAPF